MLARSIRILNFDDSVASQKGLIEQYPAEIIDLKDIAPRARFWSSGKTMGQVRERTRRSEKSAVTFLGSGDFHHVSSLLIEQFDMPLCVMSFDLHPDWDILPPRFGCGSWVHTSLEDTRVLKFLLIGVSSKDISSARIHMGDIGALEGDRVEIYPYVHGPTLVLFRRVPQNVSIAAERGLVTARIHWSELRGRDMADFFSRIFKRLPTEHVYLTIDKDCLRPENAVTNWEEGALPLGELLEVLRVIKKNLDIVGVDIVGDYSPLRLAGTWKTIFSYLDHPRGTKAETMPLESITALNETTNLEILAALLS